MRRFFNTAGANREELHYTLPPTRRLVGVRELIDRQNYFVIHAPRQVGKTTSFIRLAQELTGEGRYAAVWLSMESGATYGEDPAIASDVILNSWRRVAEKQLPPELLPPPWPKARGSARIGAALTAWSLASSRPLVVFLDEIDALSNQTLVAVLRQLREGFFIRPDRFPWSLALIGLRDIRDYKVSSTSTRRMGTASPFNVSVESLTLQNFTPEEICELYSQHTAETGQRFESGVFERVYELTQGQPWLVNALARQMVEVLVKDVNMPVALHHVDQAKEIVIQRRDTHLDSLAERLREPRVRQIIEPILAGTMLGTIPDDDRQFVVDLGLVKRGPGGLEIANPIYSEVLPRVIADNVQDTLGFIEPIWLRSDGSFDPKRLLESFVEFWREAADALLPAASYLEIAPHIVLMAYLHRVVNGGGSIQREYALGRGRIDLVLTYGATKMAMELKVWRKGEIDPLKKGLVQLDGYLGKLGLETGWLVIFDQRPERNPTEERTVVEAASTPSGREIVVVRA